jgi:hypothetical protein
MRPTGLWLAMVLKLRSYGELRSGSKRAVAILPRRKLNFLASHFHPGDVRDLGGPNMPNPPSIVIECRQVPLCTIGKCLH